VPSEKLIPDLGLAACPQQSNVCGIPAGWVFADQTSSKQQVTIADGALTSVNKCTYIIYATKDAPGFEILNGGMTGVDLFYVEMNDASMLGGSFSHIFYPDPADTAENSLTGRSYD